MRSMVMSVFYLSQALGGWFGAGVVGFVNLVTDPIWIGVRRALLSLIFPHGLVFQEDVNSSRLDLYFFAICAIGVVNFFVYSFLAKTYVMNEYDPSGNYVVQSKAGASGGGDKADDAAVVSLDSPRGKKASH